MDSDLLRAVCALAAFGLPVGVAWLIVRCQAASRKRREKTLK